MSLIDALAAVDNDTTEFVFFDLETTGLEPSKDKITEIGAVKIKGGIIVGSISQLVDPCIPIPAKITEITGITNQMVQGKPVLKDVLPGFEEFIKDTVLVAHNIRFDSGFIKEALGVKKLPNQTLDTIYMAKKAFSHFRSFSLQNIAKSLNIPPGNAHRALDDVKVCLEVFRRCMKRIRPEGVFSRIESFKDSGTIIDLTTSVKQEEVQLGLF